MEAPVKPVAQMLMDWHRGRTDVLDDLIPIVCEELRRLTRRYLSREGLGTRCRRRPWCTRRICASPVRGAWDNRAQLLALAAQMMRRIWSTMPATAID
jgi:hypothetical protein